MATILTATRKIAVKVVREVIAIYKIADMIE